MEKVNVLCDFANVLREDLSSGCVQRPLRLTDDVVQFLVACIWTILQQIDEIDKTEDRKDRRPVTSWDSYRNISSQQRAVAFIESIPVLKTDDERIQTLILLQVVDKTLEEGLGVAQTLVTNTAREVFDAFIRALQMICRLDLCYESDFVTLYRYEPHQTPSGQFIVKEGRVNTPGVNEDDNVLSLPRSYEKEFVFLKEYESDSRASPNIKDEDGLTRAKSSLLPTDFVQMDSRDENPKDSLELRQRRPKSQASGRSPPKSDSYSLASDIPPACSETGKHSSPKVPSLFFRMGSLGLSPSPTSIQNNSSRGGDSDRWSSQRKPKKPSVVLYETEYAPPLLKRYSYRRKFEKESTLIEQHEKCFECGKDIKERWFSISPRSFLCHYTGKWFCEEHISPIKRVIPWRVTEKLDFTPQRVSLRAGDELDLLYDKPILLFSFSNELILRNETLYSFLVIKRKFHLIYDLVCEPPLVLEYLDTFKHFVLKDLIVSLKDLVDYFHGNLRRTLMIVVERLGYHIRHCITCRPRGKICPICETQERIYTFQIEETVYCKGCKHLYHLRCYQKVGCLRCTLS
eukprot:TRINITY_DN5678_c0_g1_i3.p1 TRINITY_DN5678_c0_g1~~TRINITY_DN5678_c0_g1_i3.p1  ORF type:complete len:573 (+),score=57.44 TRINITY_DN5678_c0_g1_i3:86-1804(+)